MASKMLRRFSSSVANFNQGRTVFARENELAALNGRLVAAVGDSVSGGNLVVVSGPKDSGKSALLREFLRRQGEGEYPGVSSFADMRGSISPRGVARMFKSSFLPSVRASQVDSWSVVKDQMDKADDMDTVLAAIKSYGVSCDSLVLKGGGEYAKVYPTIVLDEANWLCTWTTDPGTKKELDQLLAFFVMVTKQEHIMNVVLASSENFFGTWLAGYIGSLRADTLNVGDLNEAEARQFFETLLPTGSDGVSDELWKDIYSHMGGRMGLLARAAGSIESWDAVKASLLSSCCLKVRLACFPEAVPANKPSKPCWTKDDWKAVVSTLVKHKDGITPYMTLCNKLSVGKVNSLIEYDLLQYRTLAAWGNDIEGIPEKDWPLVMPSTSLHFRAMQRLAKTL
ncbi:hypothetical protein SELMODRAFT_406201 [Selaginella moellendorffii]|uniref:ATPase domain-containing protein n=1 Tax=Selaginella moellendorffii TaxID=88036 RepID=D8R1L4_SELML|nr:hypothetical protein SELMODRAFT_406201 [Selaginella moellendorffii]